MLCPCGNGVSAKDEKMAGFAQFLDPWAAAIRIGRGFIGSFGHTLVDSIDNVDNTGVGRTCICVVNIFTDSIYVGNLCMD